MDLDTIKRGKDVGPREDVIVSKNTGRAFTLEKGQHIRITGQSIVDFVAFNLDNLTERLSQARTKANQGKIFISSGDKLISMSNNVMLTITKDTYEGTHDLQFGMCSRASYPVQSAGVYQYPFNKDNLPDHGCWENLTEALRPWEIAPEDIPSPFNIFQTMRIDGNTGRMELDFYPVKPRPKPGTYVELRAEMNCLVAVSACPQAGWGEAIEIQVHTGSDG